MFAKEMFNNLGINIRNVISNICDTNLEQIEEIRIRVNRPLMVVTSNGDYFINSNGNLCDKYSDSYISKISDIHQSVELMTENSIYAHQDEMKNGYLTLSGGHRIGIVGKTIIDNGIIKSIKDISSINIRIARQIKGCANIVIPFIINDKSIYHTLIISPPNCGKTTLLRDIIRQISGGIEKHSYIGIKVGIVDERSEIAACHKGIPQNDIGIRSDVLDSCPKSQGISMLVRSMSPNVIATDELGTLEDIKAVKEALCAGIKIITTAHAGDINELINKSGIGKLAKGGLFERIIILNKKSGTGSIGEILDGSNFTPLWRRYYAS